MEINKPYEYLVKYQDANGNTLYRLSVAVWVAAGTGTGNATVTTQEVGDHLETFITIPIQSDTSTEGRVMTSTLNLDPQPNETDLEITTQLANGQTAGTNKKRYSEAADDEE